MQSFLFLIYFKGKKIYKMHKAASETLCNGVATPPYGAAISNSQRQPPPPSQVRVIINICYSFFIHSIFKSQFFSFSAYSSSSFFSTLSISNRGTHFFLSIIENVKMHTIGSTKSCHIPHHSLLPMRVSTRTKHR